MKLGFNLLLWTGHVDEELFPLFEKLKATGYDGVEIPIFGGEVEHYAKIGKRLDELGLGRTVVTVIPDQEHNPLSDDAEARKGAREQLRWAVDCCAALGAERMVGPYHQPLGEFTGNGPTAEEKKRAAEVHNEAAEYAQQQKVALSIEYLNRFECYFLTTMADAAAHVKRVDHPNFKTMYDTFHANIEEKDPVQIIHDYKDVIGHVHISENDRGVPGTGHVEFDKVFAALKEIGYSNYVTIEAFGRALPDLAAATRVWRDLHKNPEEVYEEGYKLLKKYTG